jgi:hypothetical protein
MNTHYESHEDDGNEKAAKILVLLTAALAGLTLLALFVDWTLG